jgi:hypothetical protein
MLKLYCPAEARCLPRPRHFPLPLAVPLNPPATPRVSESAKDQTTQKWTCQPPETSIQILQLLVVFVVLKYSYIVCRSWSGSSSIGCRSNCKLVNFALHTGGIRSTLLCSGCSWLDMALYSGNQKRQSLARPSSWAFRRVVCWTIWLFWIDHMQICIVALVFAGVEPYIFKIELMRDSLDCQHGRE